MEVHIDGGTVQVDTTGSGPALVLVHSLLTDSRAYDLVMPALARSHTVHRISLPGFGASSPLPHDDVSIYDLADRVAATMDALGCGPETAVLGNGLFHFFLELLLLLRQLVYPGAAGLRRRRAAGWHALQPGRLETLIECLQGMERQA